MHAADWGKHKEGGTQGEVRLSTGGINGGDDLSRPHSSEGGLLHMDMVVNGPMYTHQGGMNDTGDIEGTSLMSKLAFV